MRQTAWDLGNTEEGNLLAQPPELPLSLFHHAPGMLDFARQVLSFVAPPATKINVVEMSNYAYMNSSRDTRETP